jgi:hypothetical protein
MRIFILLIALASVLFGCSHKEQTTAPVEFVDATITVRFGETAAIPNTNLSIQFNQNILDRRLPSGVEYPWYPNTTQLGMTILPSGQKMHLYISGEIIDSAGVHFFGQPVHIGEFEYQMKFLDPLPIELDSWPPDSELVATIKVTKTAMISYPDTSFFPVALGNRWIYADTSFQRGPDTPIVTATSVDTFTITDTYIDVFGEWWVLSHRLHPFYGGELMVRNDSVFTREFGEGVANAGNPFSYTSIELLPPQGDSSGYSFIYDGDMLCTRSVTRLDSAVVTPCGSFDSTWEYRAGVPSPEFMEKQILKPGIGFVFMQFDVTFAFSDISPITRRMWLTEYLINK